MNGIPVPFMAISFPYWPFPSEGNFRVVENQVLSGGIFFIWSWMLTCPPLGGGGRESCIIPYLLAFHHQYIGCSLRQRNTYYSRYARTTKPPIRAVGGRFNALSVPSRKKFPVVGVDLGSL